LLQRAVRAAAASIKSVLCKGLETKTPFYTRSSSAVLRPWISLAQPPLIRCASPRPLHRPFAPL